MVILFIMDKRETKITQELKLAVTNANLNIGRLYTIVSALYQEIQDVKRFTEYKQNDTSTEALQRANHLASMMKHTHNQNGQMQMQGQGQMGQMGQDMNMPMSSMSGQSNMSGSSKLKIINN